jgi:hypothetical protein
MHEFNSLVRWTGYMYALGTLCTIAFSVQYLGYGLGYWSRGKKCSGHESGHRCDTVIVSSLRILGAVPPFSHNLHVVILN